MLLRNCDMYEFKKRIEGKKIICIGFKLFYTSMIKMFPEVDVHTKIEAFVDNNPRLIGECIRVIDREFVIQSFSYMERVKADTHIILICSRFYNELIDQMNAMECLENVEGYCYPIMHSYTKMKCISPYRTVETQVIPKVIHYCWFGNRPMPEFNQKCIESWKKYCSDYTIVRWDESNYDYTKVPYMKEAYDNKAWTFVSDYARIDIISQNGGIYLSPDVELKKNLDELLYNEGFVGFSHHHPRVNLAAGFGARKGLPILQEWLNAYKYVHYEKDDGGLNPTLCPIFQTDVLRNYASFVQNGKFQVVDGLAIYPKEFFSALSITTGLSPIMEYAYSIHHVLKTKIIDEGIKVSFPAEEALERTRKVLLELTENE